MKEKKRKKRKKEVKKASATLSFDHLIMKSNYRQAQAESVFIYFIFFYYKTPAGLNKKQQLIIVLSHVSVSLFCSCYWFSRNEFPSAVKRLAAVLGLIQAIKT